MFGCGYAADVPGFKAPGTLVCKGMRGLEA